MTRFPSFEDVLTEIHQGLGLARDPRKPRFLALDMELVTHIDFARRLIEDIFDALGLGGDARMDAIGNAMEFGGFHKAVELRTCTSNASQQQVLWHLLAYSYVPAVARRLAFWTLANVEAGAPALDAGMPGGKFWFLPAWEKDEDRIDLPLKQVLDWLLDLLEASSVLKLEGRLRTKDKDGHEREIDVRTLNDWRYGRNLPKSFAKIAEIFSDDVCLEFPGAFVLERSLPEEAQFQAALDFVCRKGLDAERLRQEIPMTEARLEPVLANSASDDEKRKFVTLLAERYAEPEMAVVRRRLQVARLMQDGYKRLLEFLCPGVEPNCTDPARNKLLQLTNLFGTIYNLTVQAWQHGETLEEQDAWFENQLAPWDKADLLLSIVVRSLNGGPRHERLAERLTRIFMTLTSDSPLPDLVPLSENDAEAIVQRRLQLLLQLEEEDARLKRLAERVRTASPWRALQEEASYGVILQFVQRQDIPLRIRDMALARLRELASTDGRQVAVTMQEAHFLLDAQVQERPKDIQARVQSLLDEVEHSPKYEEWKAPLHRLRAKHRLFQNNVAGAKADFDAALKACGERAFGPVRGEIAREAFAVTIGDAGLNLQNDQRYHRQMLAYCEFTDKPPTFENAAAECEEFFWSDLYHPYPGVDRMEGPAVVQYVTLFKETLTFIEKADWDGLRGWLKAHKKKFNKNLKDARRNSVLLAWMKMLPWLRSDIRSGMNEGISILLGAWPDQAKIGDFKGQTPLMLAADGGDAKLVRLLVPLSDVDAQDYLGRTALHAAAAGRSPECVKIILDAQPLVADKVTVDEQNTALHTAVRFGVPENVRLIAEAFPGLVTQTNAAQQTPLDIAQWILVDHAGWVDYMKRNGRRTGTLDDIASIVELLDRQWV